MDADYIYDYRTYRRRRTKRLDQGQVKLPREYTPSAVHYVELFSFFFSVLLFVPGIYCGAAVCGKEAFDEM